MATSMPLDLAIQPENSSSGCLACVGATLLSHPQRHHVDPASAHITHS